jgi:tetratricopeptide (TPR) repeat protein
VSLQGDLLRDSGAIDASIAAFERALDLADDDLARCRAWIGKAAGLGIQDQHEAVLAALAQAEALAVGRAGAAERAQIHYHRGNVLFTLARIEECLREHEQALDDARKAASPLVEARALSGLADAYYQRGRMGTAQGHLDRCIALCRKHGFGRIEAANLAMRGIMRFYRNDLKGALTDNREAATLAARVGNRRDESLARNILGTVLLYRGDWNGAKEQAEHSLALIRPLGAKRFEAENLCTVGQALAQLGSPSEAETLVETAYALSRESGLAYNGPWILGALALVTSDREKRRRALAEAESILRAGAVSHNYLHFYQIAIDVALGDNAWGEAERYAAALEEYTRAEPLPWAEFFIARGRALARFGEGGGNPQLLAILSRLREEAERVGLGAALPAIRAALCAV